MSTGRRLHFCLLPSRHLVLLEFVAYYLLNVEGAMFEDISCDTPDDKVTVAFMGRSKHVKQQTRYREAMFQKGKFKELFEESLALEWASAKRISAYYNVAQGMLVAATREFVTLKTEFISDGQLMKNAHVNFNSDAVTKEDSYEITKLLVKCFPTNVMLITIIHLT